VRLAPLLLAAGCAAGTADRTPGGRAADRPPAVGVRAPSAPVQPALGTRAVPVITVDGLRFRDLDRDGRLTPYEDWRLDDAGRTEDLVARMSLAEKIGTLLHGTLPSGERSGPGASGPAYDLAGSSAMLLERHVTSAITRLAVPPREMAEQNNAVQAIAEAGRLGIPLTISTDPRHHFQAVYGASSTATGWSQWPEPLGFAAIGDAALVRRFATIAGREYRATGLHEALSPQADLFTEPRWPRGTATFGSDPARVSELAGAYVAGFQGSDTGLARDGVITVVKHWAGYGATPSGWDGHNYYGRFARVDDASFEPHLRAFEGAFRAGVAGVMPTYSIVQGATVDGRPLEPVGGGYSRQLLTTLLRGRFGFDGFVLSDWAITNDCSAACRDPVAPHGFQDIAMPWGVESLSRLERFAKGLDAGIDQFGGTEDPAPLVEAVRTGRVSEARIDASVRRILRTKFRLGLFENPYVDPAVAEATSGTPELMREAVAAQAASQVLLKDEGVLPLRAGTRVFLHGVDRALATARGLVVVDSAGAADIAILRLSTPFETLHPHHFFGSRQNEGRLDFRPGNADYDRVAALPARVKLIAAPFLDRPAVLGDIVDRSAVLLANFGVSDDALLDVLTGRAQARGRLPFELPSSMAAVEAQDPARPDDSVAPRFPAGAGMMAR
jgi:beta-glucosidase